MHCSRHRHTLSPGDPKIGGCFYRELPHRRTIDFRKLPAAGTRTRAIGDSTHCTRESDRQLRREACVHARPDRRECTSSRNHSGRPPNRTEKRTGEPHAEAAARCFLCTLGGTTPFRSRYALAAGRFLAAVAFFLLRCRTGCLGSAGWRYSRAELAAIAFEGVAIFG